MPAPARAKASSAMRARTPPVHEAAAGPRRGGGGYAMAHARTCTTVRRPADARAAVGRSTADTSAAAIASAAGIFSMMMRERAVRPVAESSEGRRRSVMPQAAHPDARRPAQRAWPSDEHDAAAPGRGRAAAADAASEGGAAGHGCAQEGGGGELWADARRRGRAALRAARAQPRALQPAGAHAAGERRARPPARRVRQEGHVPHVRQDARGCMRVRRASPPARRAARSSLARSRAPRARRRVRRRAPRGGSARATLAW